MRQIEDEQYHTQTKPQLENEHHWLHGPVFKVCIGNRAPHCRTVLQKGQDKTTETFPKKRSIMEHSPGVPQDTKCPRLSSQIPLPMQEMRHLSQEVVT